MAQEGPMTFKEISRMRYLHRRYKAYYKIIMPSQRTKFHLKIVKTAFYWLSLYIKAADRNRCKSCSSTEQLHAHHIYPKKDFPHMFWMESNLITLCKKCHGETHGYWV